ncbi:MAG: DUF47 family protein [bacterium]
MAFSFIPKEMKFFDLFAQQAVNAQQAADHFKALVHSGKFDDKGVQEMKELEHEGDTIAHEITNMLNRTFITPFDREDIHSLAHEMDDIVDYINSITRRMRLYKLNTVNEELVQFADVIEQSVKALGKAVAGLRDISRPTRILDYCIEINRLENVGDQLREHSISKLFDSTPDPILLIKWKEIYEQAEVVLDKCEHVAKIIESILVKQS